MNAGSGILRAGLFGTIFALVLPLFSPTVCVGFIDEPKLTYFGHNEFRVPGLEGELITVTNDKISFVDKHGYVNIFDIGDGHVINSFEVSIEANRWAWRSIVHDKNLQRFAIAEWRRIEIFNTLTPTDPLVKIELPPGDQEWPIKPSPLLTFSVDGEEIAVFDLQTSTFSVFETNSGNLRYYLPVKDIWQIVPSIGGEYWLMSDQSISIIAQGKCKRIHRTDNSESFKSVRMSGSTVFTVTYKSGNNFVVERDAETFDARNRWLCNSWFIAVIGGRPIFSLDCKLFRGEENGEKTALCSCDDKIVRLQESPSNKHLVGQIEGGVLVWDTASWMPNTHNSSPRQNDLTFAVNDQGRLSILSGYNLLKSSNEGIDFDATSLPNSMSREPGEFSLSTNGGGLVYLDDSNHVFHLSVNVENAAPTLVKLPESCLPTGVSIGEDGQTILIRYDLKIVRNDPDARNKTLEKNRQELRRKLFDEPPTANSVLTEGCHVFKPGDANPLATGVICTEADLSDKSNLFIHTKTKMIGWIGEDHVGIWKFSEPQTKATITGISFGENSGPAVLNSRGDAVYRWVNMSNRDPKFMASIYWQPVSGGRRKLIVREQYLNNLDHKFAYALSDDGKRLYLAESKGSFSSLSAMELPEKKLVWQLRLPSRTMAMRLSPNNQFLGIKLGDSRYAIVQLFGNSEVPNWP